MLADDAPGQLGEQVALELEPFRGGLDHQLARAQLGELRSALEASPSGIGFGVRPAAALDAPLQLFANLRHSTVESLRDGVVQQRASARPAGQLRDSCAHRAGAGDPDDLGGAHCPARRITAGSVR